MDGPSSASGGMMVDSTYGTYFVYGNHDRQRYTSDPEYTEEELAKMTVQIPNCLYNTGNYAQSVCEGTRYGLTVEFVGDPAGVVIKQYPEAGTVIEKSGGRIILYIIS